MYNSFSNPENWEYINHHVHSAMGLDPGLTVRIYPCLQQAVMEVVFGTALFYSHKKSLTYFKGQTYGFEAVLPFLYKESFQIQSLSLKNFKQQFPDQKAWIDGLPKDTNFVLTTEDHPWTGETFQQEDTLGLLNIKKIFSFVVSHAKFRCESIKVLPYQVLICDLSPDLTLAICGSKFKTPVQTTNYFNWDKEKVLAQVSNFRSSTDKNSVLDFENKISAQYAKLLAETDSRIFDRAMIYNLHTNSNAIEKFLSPSTDSIRSFNLCEDPTLNYDWWENHPRPEVLRGLMSVSLEFIKQSNSAENILKAISECQI